ncbi:hypothetical protein CERZMDRAFT_87848 [Cercospora zeae-maydis SCOH1-5]|uniref:RING-type domain-containing protein n=1 Tax=Cercospora zeae-maydis SCOH1-5 TaxID=717836 RepID=A0A6A6F4D3_9PEZI|nr:hypothetical protein CERZMDRAFT_87848 [Cercospora zeae-maydis SCOH1-5]
MTSVATDSHHFYTSNEISGTRPQRVYIDLTGDEPVEYDPFDEDQYSKSHSRDRCDPVATKRTKQSEHHDEHANNRDICAICQELLTTSGTRTTDGIPLTTFRAKCKHTFHAPCFTQHIVETDVRLTADTILYSTGFTNRRDVVVVRCPLCRAVEVEFLRSETGRQAWDAVAKAVEDEVRNLFEE